MATLTVTNTSSINSVYLTDLYITLAPFGSSKTTGNGGVASTFRALTDIPRMSNLLFQMSKGLVTVTIAPTPAELAENADTLGQVPVQPGTSMSEDIVFRKALTLGVGASADDVPVVQLGALPEGLRIIDAVALVSTAVGGSTLQLWSYPQADVTSVTTVATGTAGSSAVTLTGTPTVAANWSVAVTTGGTIGTSASIQVTKNGVPATIVALATATTYLIPSSGITLNFGGGTLITGQSYTFQSWVPDVSAVTFTGTGSSAVTVTGTPAQTDTISMAVPLGGTIGTGPITINVTVNGLSQGNHSLATATSYAIPAFTGAVTHVGTGTSAVTLSGTALLNAAVSIAVATGGTEGTADSKSIVATINGVALSPVALAGSATYVIPTTGITATFGAGSLIAGDSYQFSTTALPGTTLNFGAGTLVTLDNAAFTQVGAVEIASFSSASTGRIAATMIGNATTALSNNSTTGLFVRRSANTVVGEILVFARQETSLVGVFDSDGETVSSDANFFLASSIQSTEVTNLLTGDTAGNTFAPIPNSIQSTEVTNLDLGDTSAPGGNA